MTDKQPGTAPTPEELAYDIADLAIADLANKLRKVEQRLTDIEAKLDDLDDDVSDCKSQVNALASEIK